MNLKHWTAYRNILFIRIFNFYVFYFINTPLFYESNYPHKAMDYFIMLEVVNHSASCFNYKKSLYVVLQEWKIAIG